MLLHLVLSSTVKKTTPVVVGFKCPVCEARDAIGEAHDQTEQYKFIHLIPIGTVRTTWINCTACKSLSRSEIPVAELARQAPGEINRYIRRSLPPALILFLALAVPTLIVPGVCLVFSLIALAMGWKYGGWVRRLAVIEVTLGVVFSIVVLVAVLLPETPPQKPTFAPIRKTAPATAPKP